MDRVEHPVRCEEVHTVHFSNPWLIFTSNAVVVDELSFGGDVLERDEVIPGMIHCHGGEAVESLLVASVDFDFKSFWQFAVQDVKFGLVHASAV